MDFHKNVIVMLFIALVVSGCGTVDSSRHDIDFESINNTQENLDSVVDAKEIGQVLDLSEVSDIQETIADNAGETSTESESFINTEVHISSEGIE